MGLGGVGWRSEGVVVVVVGWWKRGVRWSDWAVVVVVRWQWVVHGSHTDEPWSLFVYHAWGVIDILHRSIVASFSLFA